jgi:ribosomal protein S18 acetylase RimI-like enzyme
MPIDYCSVDAFELGELGAMLNRCFDGYILPVHFDRQTIAKLVRVDSVDLAASVAARHGGETIGVALVARRGWTSRLAAMAVAPNFRGQRTGTRLTDFVIRAARERGDRSFVLEVVEQNAPALRLYQAAGFTPVHRLFGYAADAIPAGEGTGLEEIDPVEAGIAAARWGVKSLPWQISPAALTALGPPHRAWRLGPATALVSNPTAEIITLCTIVVEPGARRQGRATRLLRALSARFPGKKWRFPILVPDEIPEAFFMRLGFRKESLNQIQMTRPL